MDRGLMLLGDERQEIVAVCRRLVEDRLVVGTAGNVSLRLDELVAVTPSGVDYLRLRPELVGVHRLDGTAVEAPLRPTSEMPLHLAVYAATGAAAIVHNHAVASTALSLVVDAIPTTHYYSALFGGQVQVAPYARFGTDQLAQDVSTALSGRTAALMSNHGAITIGENLGQAYERSVYLEWLCDVQLRAMSTGQPLKVLPPEEIAEVGRLVAEYGQSVPPPTP
jgi:L-fuculose-phosphate aldolase